MVGLHAYQISSLKELQKWMRIFDKLDTMLFAGNMIRKFIFKIWKEEQFYD